MKRRDLIRNTIAGAAALSVPALARSENESIGVRDLRIGPVERDEARGPLGKVHASLIELDNVRLPHGVIDLIYSFDKFELRPTDMSAGSVRGELDARGLHEFSVILRGLPCPALRAALEGKRTQRVSVYDSLGVRVFERSAWLRYIEASWFGRAETRATFVIAGGA